MAGMEYPINYAKPTQQIRPDNLPPPPPLLLQRTPVIGQNIPPTITNRVVPVHQSSHQGNSSSIDHVNSSNQLPIQATEDLNVQHAERHEPNLKEKYSQLLSMIDDMSRDLRQAYAGSKTSTERLKRSMNQTKILVRDLMNESERRSIK